MSVLALIVFTQNAISTPSGRAHAGVVGLPVTITNGDNTGVINWKITLLDVPTTSTLVPGVLAQGFTAVPTVVFTPDVFGSYRIMLEVSDGTFHDKDIRNFGIPNSRGFIVPSYQGLPEVLPLPGSGLPGAKPDEQNYGVGTRGFAGTGVDGQFDQFFDTVDDAQPFIITASPFTVPNRNSFSLYVVDLLTTGNAAIVKLPLLPRPGHKVRITALRGAALGHVVVVPPLGHAIYSLPAHAIVENNTSVVFVFAGLVGPTKYWVMLDGSASTGGGSSVSGGGAPTKDDKILTPLVTVGDEAPTGIFLTHTPIGDRYVTVNINGVSYRLGDGVKLGVDCYFSDDGGVTAKNLVSIIVGDQLIWNGVIANFDLDATDIVDLDYDVGTSLGFVVSRPVRNETGGPLTNGTIVSISGYSIPEMLPLVQAADKDNAALRPAIGVLPTTINDGDNGEAFVVGTIQGVDTSAFALTDQLVLGNAGAFSKSPPEQSPFTGRVQPVGFVSRVGVADGEVIVCMNGVAATSGPQVFALAGTSGTPGPANKYVTDADPRNSDSRTPTGAAGGDLLGTYPNPTVDESGIDHNSLANLVIGDPHTQYQLESEKDTANGYAGLDGLTKLNGAQQKYGSIANTACEGNDARLNDARAIVLHDEGIAVTATPHTIINFVGAGVTVTNAGGGEATVTISSDAPSGPAGGDLSGTYPNPTIDESLVDHNLLANLTTGDPHTQYQQESEKNAANGYAGLSALTKLSGTQQLYGALASTACEGNDSRLSDSRTPTGAASGGLAGTYPSPTVNGMTAGVLTDDAAHGSRGNGSLHTVATVGTAGFMSAADKTKLDGLPTSAVPTTRTLTAGAGLTGGGDLSADRTFDVVANADGSIVVAANDVKVGILATDAQHGTRGGGATLHPNATVGVSGFMSAADKTKLDGVATGANVSVLRQTTFTELAADTTTTSTTFVTLLTQVITPTAGGILIIKFTFACSNTNGAAVTSFRITIDAVAERGVGTRAPAVGDPQGGALIIRKTGLSAAAHTVLVEWKTTIGTSSIRPVSVPNNEHASLVIMEVSA